MPIGPVTFFQKFAEARQKDKKTKRRSYFQGLRKIKIFKVVEY
jgi:hypothetical protein